MIQRFRNYLKPYAQLARVDKPTGTMLLYLPCTWSIGMAAYANYTTIGLIDVAYTGGLFGLGAFLMRGAGCTINDIWDQDLDKKVGRCKDRPLASGKLTTKKAIGFLGMQLGGGLGVLLQLNTSSILLGASSMLLVSTYPLMKRITHWPQVFLGLTFNWGALLGWVALVNQYNWPVMIPLYMSGVLWTVVYDTIYAFQDIKDDKVAGVKSSAIALERAPKKYLSFLVAGQVSMLLVAGILNGHGLPFYVVSVGGSALHSAWQLTTWKPRDPADAALKFKSSAWLGSLVTLGILLDFLHKKKESSEKIEN